MKKIIITGIQMRNKGSQAMFLSLYSALRRLYKDCEVIGFAFKTDSPEQYAFKLLPHDDYTRLVFKYRLNNIPFLTPFLTRFAGMVRKTDKWNGKIAEMDKALREADLVLDASGYTLGSGWSKKGGAQLLDTIRTARRYNKKIVLMPQSFGPFDWGEDDDAQFLEEVKRELAYCSKIYARETEGYECLKSLGLDNVELSADLVIREEAFPKASEIFVSGKSQDIDYPERGSVGFIVNENLFRIGDPASVRRLYAQMLDKLVEKGEKVYFLNTSTADLKLTEEILSETQNRDKVSVITGDYSSPELIDMISRFKYVVASRYHSIVFAYRSGVPAIIFGWAVKYTDLAAHFGQQDYVFDVRNPSLEQLIKKIDEMGERHQQESQLIKQRLDVMQSSSVVRSALDELGLGAEVKVEFKPTQKSRAQTKSMIPSV
ncbi:polysaccharide pyruvyl transferase WcaK-like protein [Altererythrobacter atlanticus]|uniref:Polysaccharide pyruvyl transferase n=1 Tax=Croceibacterium atlanticum TaxID=1267766 RepID=A0A0F7KTR7_9SPHN|nr:polysaccharide pyruvyl transferase family protein [Croceibacterium atlanticum]AKH42541.1 Polysaccharide pyruvyl transferase [Croceibacterium atlanticum]MBB5731318.1 polysaccharide pyruvyl transferase WcaK-like protein [Croceibacterium atlanticum]